MENIFENTFHPLELEPVFIDQGGRNYFYNINRFLRGSAISMEKEDSWRGPEL